MQYALSVLISIKSLSATLITVPELSWFNLLKCLFVFFYTVAGITGHNWRGRLFRPPLSFPGQQNGWPKVLSTGWSPCPFLSLLHPTCSWKAMWVCPFVFYSVFTPYSRNSTIFWLAYQSEIEVETSKEINLFPFSYCTCCSSFY